MIVPRTCTEILAGNADQQQKEKSQPLEAFQGVPAYVMLGDPGAGKTTAFEVECESLGEKAYLITARDFMTFDPQGHPEWRHKTLFIDGLDEIRVGAKDTRTPFDQIRGRLDTLERPCFRLSCREADWLGENDRKHLESVSPDFRVKVLRLDPLTLCDVERILKDRGINTGEFIEAAQERGIDGLLTNPQALEMLAKVVGGGGGWPESRMETFEMACRQMVREHNAEHQAAQQSGSPPSLDQLLDAAGHICALQLISGGAGYTLRDQPDEEYPDLDQCGYDSPSVVRFAIATKLFQGASSNRFTSVHRHLAEFLGARYLARVIQDGLPPRRVVSLMTGEDGTVVTEMRGLSAWLAANCQDARPDLIERDPIGVGLYGDIHEFSTEDKGALLASLKVKVSLIENAYRLDFVWRIAEAFGGLATSEMEPLLREVLADGGHDRDHQLFTDFVLRFLAEGAPLAGLSGILLELVRDDTRWPRVSTSALKAFIHNCPGTQDEVLELKSLLADIRTGRVSDSDNELLGILLYELYPRDLTGSEVWDCFFETRNREFFFGMFYGFFMHGLLQKSSNDQIAKLLDGLHERFSSMRHALEAGGRLENLPVKLLARGLQAHGDKLATNRLYDWLNVGFRGNLRGFPVGDPKDIQEIRLWLKQRPIVQKNIVFEGLSRCPVTNEVQLDAFKVLKRWYGATQPPDFGLWCLKQAVAMVESKPLVAESLLEWAVRAHTEESSNEGLSLGILKDHTRKNERLKIRLDRLLAPRSISPLEQKYLEQERTFTEERQRKKEEWIEYLRSQKTALRENRVEPALLDHLARAYFGHFYDLPGDDGPEIISKLLRGDLDLIDACLKGLCGTVDRQDVPEIEEILDLRKRERRYFFSLPFLAGLAEIQRTVGGDSARWNNNRIRKGLIFYFCEANAGFRAFWYQRLLEARPETVADMQVRFAVTEFRCGRGKINNLRELAHDPEHAQVAKRAVMPLLRAFPTRCKVNQIQALNSLILAAVQHSEKKAFQELIEWKLSLKRMNVAQRVHWLVAGAIVSPREFHERLNEFVEDREGRIRHLTTFFFSQGSLQPSIPELDDKVMELVIRLVGRYFQPGQFEEGWGVQPAMEASRLVNDLIQRLSASPTSYAREALDSLCFDPTLERWHEVLSQARDSQRVIRRDAGYRHPSIEQVCQTLNDGTPANVADLAALLVGRFEEIGSRINTNNANYWRPYWNEDENQKRTTPKHENSCRDALLYDLRLYFPNAEPEIQYVNNTRADIRVSYGGFQVPVEIKKASNSHLWEGLRDQLIAKYTREPATGGYGIYLVFWFDEKPTPPQRSGTTPSSPQEVKEQLKAKLSREEKSKIAVCVIDVSRPD